MAKMLSIHVPALLPATSAEVDVPPMVQTAALMGVGLLYQGTAHRRISEVRRDKKKMKMQSTRCKQRNSCTLTKKQKKKRLTYHEINFQGPSC